MPEWPKGADCKSAGRMPSKVRILPSPPDFFSIGGKTMRIQVALKCSECGNKNYYTTRERNKKEKLELRKYCPKCNKHTKHVETKA